MSITCPISIPIKRICHLHSHDFTTIQTFPSNFCADNETFSYQCPKLFPRYSGIKRGKICLLSRKNVFRENARFSATNRQSKTDVRWSGVAQSSLGNSSDKPREHDSSENSLEGILEEIQDTLSQKPYLQPNAPPSADPAASNSNEVSSDTCQTMPGPENELHKAQLQDGNLHKRLLTLAQSLTRLSTALGEVAQDMHSVADAIGEKGMMEMSSRKVPRNNVLTMAPVTDVGKEPEPYVKMDGQTAVDKTHELAFRLQRAYVQARIQGLGKPFELAMEDFVTACMEARAKGVDLPQMQLLLILAEGSLPSQFSTMAVGKQPNPFVAEEGRVRTSWIRLVYTTLHLVDGMNRGLSPTAPEALEGSGPSDPMDRFVVQTVTLALEDGYDLSRVYLEQQKQGPPTSQAVKMMRESQFLILLALQKATM